DPLAEVGLPEGGNDLFLSIITENRLLLVKAIFKEMAGEKVLDAFADFRVTVIFWDSPNGQQANVLAGLIRVTVIKQQYLAFQKVRMTLGDVSGVIQPTGTSANGTLRGLATYRSDVQFSKQIRMPQHFKGSANISRVCIALGEHD